MKASSAVAGDATDHLSGTRVIQLDDGSYVVSFEDNWSDDLRAQRLDEDGNLFWPAGPRTLATGPWARYAAEIAPVLDGGFVGTWMDVRSGDFDVYAQYLDNHGFCGDIDSLPADDVEITHVNLNDQTLEGLRHKHLLIFSVQYHPEASPGPHDARYLFDEFTNLMRKAAERT